MSISSGNSYSINELNSDITKIQTFIESLDPGSKGKGLLTYNPITSQFYPSSPSFARSRTLEAIFIKFDPNASITTTLEGFQKAADLSAQIFDGIKHLSQTANPNFEEENRKLNNILLTISTKSMPCARELIGVYKAKKYDPETVRKINDLVKFIFHCLKESAASLYEKHRLKQLVNPEEVDLSFDDEEEEVEEVTTASLEITKTVVAQFATYREGLCSVQRHPYGVKLPLKLIQGVIDDCQRRDRIKKTGLKQTAIAAKVFSHTPPLMAQDGAVKWTAYRLFHVEPNTITITENSSVGTCERVEGSARNNLVNLKIQLDQGQIVMSCGVIDTILKADELIEGVCIAIKKRALDSTLTLRIVMHQLNTFFNDRDLILNQHRLSRYIEQRLAQILNPLFIQTYKVTFNPKLLVAHINTPLNFGKSLPGEEKKSRRQNLEGLATLALWINEDITADIGLELNLATLSQSLGVLRLTVESIKAVKSKIDLFKESKQSISGDEKVKLKELQEELLGQLKQLAELTNKICYSHQKQAQLSENARLTLLKLKVLTLILGKQTKILPKLKLEHVSRVTELELYLILDMLSGNLAEINCRSGLDRTALMRSKWDSLRTILKARMALHSNEREGLVLAFQDLLTLVLNQDTLTELINNYYQEFLKDEFIAARISTELDEFQGKTPYTAFRTDFIDFIREKQRNSVSVDKTQAIIQALEYQDLFAYHIFSVAQVITGESTGVVGLKYGHDVFLGSYTGNPHASRRFPMFIHTEEGKLIRLYSINKMAMNKINLPVFTNAGLQLIMRCSQNRGD